jgi:hypothetical protein
MTSNYNDSTIEIGGYDLKSYARNPSKGVVWFDLVDSLFWMVFVNGFQVGEAS